MILAAGTGTRFMPLTKAIPKALITIANRSLLEYAVGLLERAGLKEIVIVTGYMGEKTAKHLENSGEHFRAEIRYVNADRYLRGPIFSLLAAERIVDGDFLLTPVDLILAEQIVAKLLASRFEENTIYTAIDNRSSVRGGTLVSYFQSSKSNLGSVLAFGPTETPQGDMGKTKVGLGISVGIAICPTETFKHARAAAKNGSTRVVDVLNRFISENGRGWCVKIGAEDYWFDVDTVETALSANRYVLQKSLLGYKPRGKLYLDKSTYWQEDGLTDSSHSLARIIGPSIIGDRSKIGDGSSIGPYVSVQHGCSIGCEVKCRNSIILDGSRIRDRTVVEDTIVCGLETLSAKKNNGITAGRDGKNE